VEKSLSWNKNKVILKNNELFGLFIQPAIQQISMEKNLHAIEIFMYAQFLIQKAVI
jgi:hypothetical protein